MAIRLAAGHGSGKRQERCFSFQHIIAGARFSLHAGAIRVGGSSLWSLASVQSLQGSRDPLLSLFGPRKWKVNSVKWCSLANTKTGADWWGDEKSKMLRIFLFWSFYFQWFSTFLSKKKVFLFSRHSSRWWTPPFRVEYFESFLSLPPKRRFNPFTGIFRNTKKKHLKSPLETEQGGGGLLKRLFSSPQKKSEFKNVDENIMTCVVCLSRPEKRTLPLKRALSVPIENSSSSVAGSGENLENLTTKKAKSKSASVWGS